MQEQISEIIIYIKGILKYKWFAINLAWCICLVGWALVMILPNQYTSVAKVHVDSTTMLKPLLRDIAVQQDTHMLVRIMSELLFTTPNLEKIIKLSNLDFSITNDIQRFELYEDMKNDIKIIGGKKDDLFEISYIANDPNMAKNVVTAVLTVFSEQTQQTTLDDASSSQLFIKQQIGEYEARLRDAEKSREAFKRTNFGFLPEGGKGQLGKLHEAYGELENAKLLQSEAVSKRDVLAVQMQEVLDSGKTWSSNDLIFELSPEDQKIEELQVKKMDLLLKYTDNYPEIIAIDIALKEAIRRKEQKEKERIASGSPNIEAMANPYVQQLKIALNEAETEVASNNTRVHVLEKRIKKHKDQLNSRLTIETEMQNLNRDYETIRDNYQKLIQRREQARMSEKVDSENVSIKFKIADPPNKPLTPSGPMRSLFLSGVLFIGLGVGFGMAYLFYYIKPTYMTTRQIREITGLPVLGNISMLMSEESNENKNIFMFLLVIAALFIVYFGLMGFEYMRMQEIYPFN